MSNKRYNGPITTINIVHETKQATDPTKVYELLPQASWFSVSTNTMTMLKTGTFIIDMGFKKLALKATNNAIIRLLELLRIPLSFASSISGDTLAKLVNSLMAEQVRFYICTTEKAIVSFSYTTPDCGPSLVSTLTRMTEDLKIDFASTVTDGENFCSAFTFRKYRDKEIKGGFVLVTQASNIVSPTFYPLYRRPGMFSSYLDYPVRLANRNADWAIDQVGAIEQKMDYYLECSNESFRAGKVGEAKAKELSEAGIAVTASSTANDYFTAILNKMKETKELAPKLALSVASGRFLRAAKLPALQGATNKTVVLQAANAAAMSSAYLMAE
jgi:hypothetical protein